jgi:hypothetical protein
MSKDSLKKIKVPDDYNYIGVFLTLNCPRRCSYCFNETDRLKKNRPLLDAKTWILGLNRLETNLPLTMCGGDPLFHPQAIEIINGIRPDAMIDLVTTMPMSSSDFISSFSPKRFQRDFPYSALRVTFHPETMNIEHTVQICKEIHNAGFDVTVNIVNHPDQQDKIDVFRDKFRKAGVFCVIKPFMGYFEGKLYGVFRYPEGVKGKQNKSVYCKTTNIIIGPEGNIYRCHEDMFSDYAAGVVGNLFDPVLSIESKYRSCPNFGLCHPCDMQIKYDRFEQWDYSVVNIVGDNIKTNFEQPKDWFFPDEKIMPQARCD